MKPALNLLLLAASALAFAPLTAQTATAKPPIARRPAPSCAKLPELSPKIPALPAGAPCAKPLYTITTVAPVVLSNVSPLEGPGLKETLGLETSSFSLLYIDTKIGSGPLALPNKWYSIQYTGYLTDGTKFDSSYDHADKLPFYLNYGKHGAILGWDTGMAGMHIGGKRRLFIPFQLAYGPQGRGAIPARAELIFDVELVAQSDKDPSPSPPPGPPTPPAPPAPRPGPPAATTPLGAPATTPVPAPAGATQPTTDPTKPTVDPRSSVPPPTPPTTTPPTPKP